MARTFKANHVATKLSGKVVIVEAPRKGSSPRRQKEQGYDFIDRRGGAIAAGAAKGIGRGIMRVVAGPKR